MSSSIVGLHLEQPPATVHRCSVDGVRVYLIRCDCGHHTDLHQTIGLALDDHRPHASGHGWAPWRYVA